ncbi:protein PML-like [Mytilus galloprovincialis]|uniref:protein PML-like n=1 Tax=Mytilus galloprovincialis TaxID=29158 RepID=UPI003F7C6815
MATSEEINVELTCTICLETFKDPKCLPCLHTFCEGYIHTYIVSTFEKDCSKGGFLCPICRVFVKKPPKETSPKSWCQKLPYNQLIQSLMDKKDILTSSKNCSSCEIQQKTQVAQDWCLDCEEVYCSQCSTFHRSFKVSSKHNIVSIHDIQRNPKDFKYRKTIYCDLHTEKPEDICCMDHLKPCCTVCAAVYHRKFDGVIPIESAAKGIKGKLTTNYLLTELSEERKAVDNAILHRKKFSSVFESQVETILKEIKNIRSDIEKHLDYIQTNIQSELNAVKKEVNLQINDDQTHLSSLKSTIENWISLIETSSSQGTEIQCFLEINKILSQKFELNRSLSDRLQEMRNVRITFKRDLCIQQLMSLQTFGSIHKQDLFWQPVNFHSGEIKHLISIVLDTEKTPHRGITGVLMGIK